MKRLSPASLKTQSISETPPHQTVIMWVHAAKYIFTGGISKGSGESDTVVTNVHTKSTFDDLDNQNYNLTVFLFSLSQQFHLI